MYKIILTVTLLFQSFITYSQSDFVDVINFPVETSFLGKLIARQNYDGGYIVAARSVPSIAVIRTDNWGNILFQKLFSRQGTSFIPQDVIPTKDSGFVVCAKSVNQGLVIKMDSNGDTLWSKIYNASGYNLNTTAVRETNDGNLVIFAAVAQLSSTNKYGTIIKVNSMGDTIFTRSFINLSGSQSQLRPIHGSVTSDGSYLMQGMDGNPWIKIDSVGNTQWITPSQIRFYTKGIVVSKFNEYYSVSHGACGSNILLPLTVEKIDSNGMFVWQKSYLFAADAQNYTIGPTNDGGFIVYGSSSTTDYFFKCDSSGLVNYCSIPYDSTLGMGNFPAYPKSIILTADSSFALFFGIPNNLVIRKFSNNIISPCPSSYCTIQPINSTDCSMNFTYASGYVPCHISHDTIDISNLSYVNNLFCSNIDSFTVIHELTPNELFDFTIFPNPISKSNFSLHTKQNKNENLLLEIFDSKSRKVFSTLLFKGNDSYNITIPGISQGIYNVTLKGDNYFVCKKLIVLTE